MDEYEKEKKEHPSLPKSVVKQIVRDHEKEKKKVPSIWDLRETLKR